MNGVLICLSSDDETDPPTPKKIKPDSSTQSIVKKKQTNNIIEKLNDSIICLSSEEENDSEGVVLKSAKTLRTSNASNNNTGDVIIVNKDIPQSGRIENSKNSEVQNTRSICINKTGTKGKTDAKELSLPNKENLISNGTVKLSVETASVSSNKFEAVESNPSSSISLSDDSIDEDDEKAELSSSSSSEPEVESQSQQNQNSEEKRDSIHRDSDLMANADDLPTEAKMYLSACLKTLSKTSAHPIYKKYPVMIKMLKLLSEEFSKSQSLSNFLKRQTEIAEETVSGCIVSFTEVYRHLKDAIHSQSIDLDKKHWKHVRKLEKTMQLLVKKLEELEEDEVDFDAEEDDSPYIKHDRYSQRLNKVYKKYCEILKKNPYAGRLTYERLAFVSSEFNQINQAISKKYKNNEKFPSYDELAQLIQKVVIENNIPLSGTNLRLECEMCFKKLGDLLQTRRKKELYEVHQKYLTEEDPAKGNKDLEQKLRVSALAGKEKIRQICDEFVKKQELGCAGEEVDLSESEDLLDEDSDSEEDVA